MLLFLPVQNIIELFVWFLSIWHIRNEMLQLFNILHFMICEEVKHLFICLLIVCFFCKLYPFMNFYVQPRKIKFRNQMLKGHVLSSVLVCWKRALEKRARAENRAVSRYHTNLHRSIERIPWFTDLVLQFSDCWWAEARESLWLKEGFVWLDKSNSIVSEPLIQRQFLYHIRNGMALHRNRSHPA